MKALIIKNTIKILNKLCDNIEQYKVRVSKYDYHDFSESNFLIQYNQQTINIDSKDGIAFGIYNSIRAGFLNEQNRYEILGLAQKLYDKTKEHTLEIMTKFADNND